MIPSFLLRPLQIIAFHLLYTPPLRPLLASFSSRKTPSNAALYSRLSLRFYDLLVWGVNSPLLWGLDKSIVRRVYEENTGSRHLEIGCGTGLFIADVVGVGVPGPGVVTFLDVNRNSLESARDRLWNDRGVKATTVLGDVLDSRTNPWEGGCEKFDSVGANFLIHCLPGGCIGDKVGLFENVAGWLAPGGVFFGSTILYDEEILRGDGRARRVFEKFKSNNPGSVAKQPKATHTAHQRTENTASFVNFQPNRFSRAFPGSSCNIRLPTKKIGKQGAAGLPGNKYDRLNVIAIGFANFFKSRDMCVGLFLFSFALFCSPRSPILMTGRMK